MDGCPGCFDSNKGQQVAFEKAKSEAIEYSKQNKIPVAIYKEAGEWKFLEAFAAYAGGYGPAIREVVSAYH